MVPAVNPALLQLLDRASAEQRAYIDDVHDPAAHTRLLATAGSGKTFSIIARAWNIVSHGRLEPHEIVILTFSRQARHDFVRKVVDVGAPLPLQNVRTIDSFARQAIDPDGKVDVSILSYTLLRFLQEATPEDVRSTPGMESLQHLFIDEAQDLNSTQYGVIMLIADKLGVGVSLVGDPNQNIYQFRGGSDTYLRGFPAQRTYTLTHNYRSMRHIVEYASHLRPYAHDEVRWTKVSPVEGASVVLHGCESPEGFEHKLLGVIGRLRERGVPLHRIAVLAPTRGQLNTDGNHRGLCHIANILALAGIAAAQLYDDGCGLTDTSEGGRPVKQMRDHVTLMTYTASKGLEWDYVMLVDANAYLVSRANYTRERFLAERYLLYVAATRAKKVLHIFAQRGLANPWLALVPPAAYRVAGNPRSLSFHDERALQFEGDGVCMDVNEPSAPADGMPQQQQSSGEGPSISSAVYSLSEHQLYHAGDRFRWSLASTEMLTGTAAQVPQGRSKFMARLMRLAFMDAYGAVLGHPPEPLKALAAALDETRIVICESSRVAQWHSRFRHNGWTEYDKARARSAVPPHVVDVIDQLDRGIPLQEYTLVSDKFYKAHVAERATSIRAAYTAYLGRTDQASEVERVTALFELAALDYALATTHYFYTRDVSAVFGACACVGNVQHVHALRAAASRIAREWPHRGPRVSIQAGPAPAPVLHGTIDLVDVTGSGLHLQFASSLRLQDVICAACHEALSPTAGAIHIRFGIFNLATGALQAFRAELAPRAVEELLGVITVAHMQS